MNPIVKKDILNVLKQAIEIMKKGDMIKLRDLSDHVIHNASIFQDKESITIAVTIYALSKIYRSADSLDESVITRLSDASGFLEQGMNNEYEETIKSMMQDISEKEKKTKYYVEEVLERAQIKKASKMFEHGISLGQVAESLGISMWDLMDYVGKTRIADSMEYETDVYKKLELARGMFR